MSKNSDTILGFSVGDPNGVGIEVILKSLTSDDLNHDFKSVLFSNYNLVKKQGSIFDLKCNFKQIENLDEADYDCINIINIDDNDFDISNSNLIFRTQRSIIPGPLTSVSSVNSLLR